MDLHKRTIVKTIIWRVIATVTTIVTYGVWTGNWMMALGAGLIANGLKTIFYYIHERLWNQTDYGRVYKKAKS